MFSPRIFTLLLLVALTLPSVAARAHCPTFDGGLGVAGPLTTFASGTLPEGKATLGLRYELTDFSPLSGAQLDQAALDYQSAHSLERQQVVTLGAAYGVTDNMTVGLSLPYVSRDGLAAVHLHPESGMAMRHDLGSTQGFGDATIFAGWRFLRRPYAGLEAALLAGVETPTGRTDETRDGKKVEVLHQPGSGSWDPLLGLAASKRFGRLSVHGNGLYTLATKGAQSTNLGDRAQLNLALAWRLGGKEDSGDCDAVWEYFYPESRRHWLLDLVLEGNGQWQEQAEVAGVRDASTGGRVVYLAPGLRLGYEQRVAVSLSFGVPVYQDLNGLQSETDYRLSGGISVGF
jgi:hypothetical protein